MRHFKCTRKASVLVRRFFLETKEDPARSDDWPTAENRTGRDYDALSRFAALAAVAAAMQKLHNGCRDSTSKDDHPRHRHAKKPTKLFHHRGGCHCWWKLVRSSVNGSHQSRDAYGPSHSTLPLPLVGQSRFLPLPRMGHDVG
jgi:hypothetical protein